MLPIKPYRNHQRLVLLFVSLLIVTMPLQAYAMKIQPSLTLEQAMERAMASLEKPTPETIQKGVEALNAVPDQDEFTVSTKTQVLQQLIDASIQSVEQGFDQYPVPVRQMTEDLSAYQATLTHTSLPAFNDFAKSQFQSLRATIEDLPKQPTQHSEEHVKLKKNVVSAKESTSNSYQILLGLLVGGIFLFTSGWVIGRRQKHE